MAGDGERVHVCGETFLVKRLAAFGMAAEIKIRGNHKVNEFDVSISTTPDFHVNEVARDGGPFCFLLAPGGLHHASL